MGEFLGLVVFGAVIGVLARLVMPGRQSIGLIMTVLLGMLGALGGYFLAELVGVDDTPGIDWIRWIFSVVVAVLFISVYIGLTGRRR